VDRNTIVPEFAELFSFRRPWPWLLLTVLVFLVAVQIFRVNSLQGGENVDASGKPVFWTRGEIFSGRQIVPGGRFLAARIDLNKRSSLTGWFKVTDTKERINCVLLPASELDPWRNGLEHRRIAETGYVPGGRVSRELEPGSYLLILDNQSSPVDREVTANFSVE
jgi:hypothetical protein